MNNNALVSVIVPTKNSCEFLDVCLKSIKEQTYPHIEIIVVDNSSADNTKEIAKKYTDKVFDKGPERSAQRNFGVSHSIGKYVLIIDSDMVISKKVVEECVNKFTENSNLKGLVIPEESFGEGFWAQCKKLERSYYVGIDWIEAARFFPRKIYDAVGGYDEENTGTEDYDLPQRIRMAYGDSSIGRVTSFIYHNEQRISLRKTCGKKFYYAQKLDKYKSIDANKALFKLQSNPLSRYKLFFSHPFKLLKNPIVGFGMLIMKTCEFACGAAGYYRNRIRINVSKKAA